MVQDIISSSIKEQLHEPSDTKPKPTYTPLEKPKTEIKNTLQKEDTDTRKNDSSSDEDIDFLEEEIIIAKHKTGLIIGYGDRTCSKIGE